MSIYTRLFMMATIAIMPFFVKAAPGVRQGAQPAKPLAFMENKGQVTDQDNKQRKDIDFKIEALGMNIFLGDAQLHYQWYKLEGEMKIPEGLTPMEQRDFLRQAKPATVKTYRMDVVLLGANPNAEMVAGEQQEYYERYYTPATGEAGVLAHTVSTVTYKNVYPNIDWVLYSKDNHLKYDFVVRPGGKVSDIKLKYEGATALQLQDGALVAETPYGNITEEKPYTYIAGSKQQIGSAFVLSGNVLSYNVAPNDGDIVIDPTINWGTYYGGSDYDYGYGVGSDNTGNSFLVGWTRSTNNIATTGAFQTTLNTTSSNYYDGFVVKFNPAGVRQWGTYYGGAEWDQFWSAACDPTGNVYVGGHTASQSGIATTGAHQTTYGGPTSTTYGDALLVKFSTTGARIWATYYGGSGQENDGHVACDASGNVFLSGQTWSTNAIATAGAHQTTLNTSTNVYDAFLVKFNSSGVRQWGTYYGDSGQEEGWGITCDPTGNVYLSGWTTSTSGIATTGSHQSSHAGSNTWDGYLVKFNTSGVRQWGTYYGGTAQDVVYDVGSDGSGNVMISGYTYSTSGIATPGAYQSTLNTTSNIYDGFLVKFNTAGVRQWGSYYGGPGNDYTWGVSGTSGGYIYTSGWTNSTTGIALPNGYQTTLGGSQDVFLVEWDPNGNPTWATYYGGSSTEWGYGNTSWSQAGYVFISGMTYSTNGIATANGHQTTGGSTSVYDAFLVSFTTDTIVFIKEPFYDTVFCPGDSLKIPYGVTYNFQAGNTFTAQLSDASGSFATPVNIGTRTFSAADTIKCQIPFSTLPGNNYRVRIVASNPVRTSSSNAFPIRVKAGPINLTASSNSPICVGSTLNLTGSSTATTPVSYSWAGPGGYNTITQNPSRFNATTAYSGDYILTATADGCTAKDTATVVVNIIPATPVITSNAPVCPGSLLTLLATSTTLGCTFSWTGPSFTSSIPNPTIANASSANNGLYSVTASKAGCTSPVGTANINIYPVTPTPTVPASIILCAGAVLNLTAYSTPTATYSWTGPNNFTSNQQNPTLSPAQTYNSGQYSVTATDNGCLSAAATVAVQVNIVSKVGGYASPNDTICTGTLATFVAMPMNGGPSPQYQWYKNYTAVPGANGLQYATSNLVTGDVFHCTMYSVGVCTGPLTVSTDTIRMTVLPIITMPSVKITSVPANPQPQELVTFTANVTNGGPLPKYQWQVNGVDMNGAIYATWSAATLRPFDKVNCIVTSNDPCANIKIVSSDTVMIYFPTHVGGVDEMDKLMLYPNPNKGSFTLSGNISSNQPLKLEVLNALGQVVHLQTVQPVNGVLEEKIDISRNVANGVYMLRIASEDGFSKQIRFTIDR